MQQVNRMLVAGIFLLSLLSCSESDRLLDCEEPVALGTVQGQVQLDGVQAHVRIAAYSPSWAPIRKIETDVEPDGSYQLLLPIGAYCLEALVLPDRCCTPLREYYYNEEGPPYSYSERDTLCVTEDAIITADFILGNAVAHLTLPDELEGETVLLHLCPERYAEDLYCSLRFTEGETITDGHATFQFIALEPGAYKARLSIGTYASSMPTQSVWLPPTRNRSLASIIDVPAAGTVTTELSYPDPPATIHGQITGSWSELGVYGPILKLVSQDSSSAIATLPTQQDGNFEGMIFYPEPVKIQVDINGSQSWYGGTEFANASVIDLQPGETSPAIEVIESGLLLDIREPTYQRCWRANVQLVNPQDQTVMRQITVLGSSRRPFYAIPNLDAGEYLLRIVPNRFLQFNWLGQWYDGVSSPEEATPIVIPPEGGIENVRIALSEGGRIAGTIWYENETGIFGVLVYVTRADDPAGLGYIHPGEDCCCGTTTWWTPIDYALRGLPDGDYKVGVWPWDIYAFDQRPSEPPEETLWYPGTQAWEDATVITAVGAQEVTEIDFDLR